MSARFVERDMVPGAAAVLPGSRPDPSPFPAIATIELFEAQAARHPGRPAAVGPDGAAATYEDLDRMAAGFASVLEDRGARAAFVAVCADPSPAAIAAILGIWKAGAVWIPLHPDQPAARLSRQLAECRARWCFADDRASAAFSFGTAERLPLRAPRARTAARRSAPEPSSAAYGIFTSGSTGQPKLAILRHDSLVNYTMFVWQQLLGGEEGLRFAPPSSLAADLGHTALFPALASGGTLEIPGRDVSRDAALFSAFVSEREVDVLKIVPSHFAALSTSGAPAAPRRLLAFGGERLDAELARTAASWCPVINHYGPTETTVGALVHRFVPPDGPGGASVPIGRPIANVHAYVLDEEEHPVAPGAPGEVWIGGIGVGDGYFGRPEETSRRFREDPFVAGSRAYRTGDRARVLPDGSIEFLGRIDDQVKVRGHRVEPGEIVAALRRHAGVADAAVSVDGSPEETRLVAAVVPRAGERLAASGLRKFLAGELPDAWIPARIAIVEELPLAPSGKVDRVRVAESTRSSGRPRNAVEEWIAAVWSEILGVPEPGVDDDFFALGGHSLAAMKVMARIRREIPAPLPLPAIFRHPTVASLAEAVSSACATSERASLPRVANGSPEAAS